MSKRTSLREFHTNQQSTKLPSVRQALEPLTELEIDSMKELGQTEEQYREWNRLMQVVEDGTANMLEIAQNCLSTFIWICVEHPEDIQQGCVWSDGTWAFFRKDDFFAYLMKTHRELVEKWTERFQQKLLRQLNCHKTTLSIEGSRGRPCTLHVYKTPVANTCFLNSPLMTDEAVAWCKKRSLIIEHAEQAGWSDEKRHSAIQRLIDQPDWEFVPSEKPLQIEHEASTAPANRPFEVNTS